MNVASAPKLFVNAEAHELLRQAALDGDRGAKAVMEDLVIINTEGDDT